MRVMFVELIHNAALLVALSVFYRVLTSLRKEHIILYKILVGFLFGFIAIVGMNMPVEYSPGIFYDGRSMILVLSGLFGGGIIGGLAALTAGTYRAMLGGVGVFAGVSTIITSVLVGLFFRRMYKNKPENIRPFILWVIGVVAHISMLSSQLLLPWDRAFDVIQNIWMPVLLVFPFATLIVGTLLAAEEKQITALESIKQSNRLFQTLSDNSPVGIFRTDADGKITYINARLSDMTGVLPEDATGHNWLNAIHPEDRDSVFKKWEYTVASKNNVHIETRFLNRDGRVYMVSVDAVPELREDRTVNGYIGTIKDITEQKKYEEALIQSEKNFRKVLDESPLGIRITDLKETNVYVNDALLEIYGGTADDFISFQFSSVYTPESYRLHQIRKAKREKGKYVPIEYEVSIVNLKGETRHLHVYRKEIIWDGLPHFQSLYSDITEKKKAEQALRDNEESFREAEKIAQMGNWENNMLTNEGKWSENLFRVLGLQPYEIKDSFEEYLNRIYPEDIHLVNEGYEETMASREPAERQLRIVLPDGSLKWVLHKIVPVFSNEELVHLKGVVMDINQQKEAEFGLWRN